MSKDLHARGEMSIIYYRLYDFLSNAIAKYPVAVLGFGRAGRAVTDHLLRLGNPPTVYDEAPVPPALQARYQPLGVRFISGFPAVFREAVLVRSPGIRPDHPAIAASLSRGAVLTGEVDLFLSATRATVIGVSGSDGKTTTANLIAAILRAAGRKVLLGGNNGTPLLPHLGALTAEDFAVVELSSFQLMTAPAPDVAVLTNLSPNHLNWHTDMAEYARAKCRILQGARVLVTNADCAATREIGQAAPLPVRFFGTGVPPALRAGDAFAEIRGECLHFLRDDAWALLPVFRGFSLPGQHNRENLAAAVLATLHLADAAAAQRAATEFRGVPHRLQTVDTVDGVTYINSSIDTSPSRTVAALSATEGQIVALCGGRGKGVPLAPMADALAARVRAVFAYGEAAGELCTLLAGRVPVFGFDAFAAAFHAAAGYARSGECVLLSPGCTAFGEFRDFEERGEVFCRLVAELARRKEV